MATADLTVLALGRQGASASEYIAEIQRRLASQQRVRFRMHAMGTSLEGSTEDILAVVGELHAVPFDQGVPRVYTVLKLDERRDRPDQTLDDKIRSVEERLGGDVAWGLTPEGSDPQIAGPAQESLQRAQILEPERRHVEDRAAVELAAADRRANYAEAPAAAVQQAEVRDERRERALHERRLVPVPHALVEAPHAPGVRADLGREVARD